MRPGHTAAVSPGRRERSHHTAKAGIRARPTSGIRSSAATCDGADLTNDRAVFSCVRRACASFLSAETRTGNLAEADIDVCREIDPRGGRLGDRARREAFEGRPILKDREHQPSLGVKLRAQWMRKVVPYSKNGRPTVDTFHRSQLERGRLD